MHDFNPYPVLIICSVLRIYICKYLVHMWLVNVDLTMGWLAYQGPIWCQPVLLPCLSHSSGVCGGCGKIPLNGISEQQTIAGIYCCHYAKLCWDLYTLFLLSGEPSVYIYYVCVWLCVQGLVVSATVA